VGKRSRRRAPHEQARILADVLTNEILDDIVTDIAGPAPGDGGLDVEPLLQAIVAGVLDDHLDRIAVVLNARVNALNQAEELIASRQFHVGDRVRIGHTLRPLYLHGRPGTITQRTADTWTVQLDEPVGRYTTGELRCRSTDIEPETT
jgi:hypothetical protein